MALRSTATDWGLVAKSFHWVMAIGMISMFAFGLYMVELPLSKAKQELYSLHKSVGITLLGLAVLRLVWRLFERRPALPEMTWWQKLAASGVHYALYVLIFALPLSGWAYNSASNFPLSWFGLVNLPRLVAADKQIKELAGQAHEALGWLLVVVLLAHIGAALFHHFVKGDHVLRAMLPFGQRRVAPEVAASQPTT